MFKSTYGTNYLPFESQDNNTRNCADCVYDWTDYGAECCDSAWELYGITCAELEGGYGWNCAGCSCPGDNATGNDCNDCHDCHDCHHRHAHQLRNIRSCDRQLSTQVGHYIDVVAER